MTEERKRGRPTMYDPAYCEAVIDHCVQGRSLTSFAASIRVSRTTITDWGKEWPEFLAACARAKAQACDWWEDQGRKIVSGQLPGSGSQLAKFGMINMGGDDWQETSKIDLSSSDGSMTPSVATFWKTEGGDDEN